MPCWMLINRLQTSPNPIAMSAFSRRQTLTGGLEMSAVLLPYGAHITFAAPTGGNTDLRVAIIRIAPAAAFEETMSSRDLAQDYATGQLAAWINYAAAELTHV